MKRICWVVVPCYNEAERLQVETFKRFWEQPSQHEVNFLFVDDGSQDETLSVLKGIENDSEGRALILHLPENGGKAEAVRQGDLRCLEFEPWSVAYWDADLATPLPLVEELMTVLSDNPRVEVVLGSRIQMLGTRIERKKMRHYFGRLFATFVSLSLDLPVYDTQCGAKMIRVTDATRPVFDREFNTTWIFDVEILGRYLALDKRARFLEHPLKQWRDVPGSKLQVTDFVKSAGQLFELYIKELRYLRA